MLVHGLWYGPAAMWPLAHTLRSHGCSVSRFNYASVSRPWQDNVADLCQHLRSCPSAQVQIVAHSLGGLLALSALAEIGAANSDRQVAQLMMLGTPLQGSAIAARLRQNAVTSRLLGHSGSVLVQGLAELVPLVAANCRLVMIAGCRPLGLGKILVKMQGEHDGTVAVSETRHPDLHAHHCIPCGHSGLLLAAEVRQTVITELFSAGHCH